MWKEQTSFSACIPPQQLALAVCTAWQLAVHRLRHLPALCRRSGAGSCWVGTLTARAEGSLACHSCSRICMATPTLPAGVHAVRDAPRTRGHHVSRGHGAAMCMAASMAAVGMVLPCRWGILVSMGTQAARVPAAAQDACSKMLLLRAHACCAATPTGIHSALEQVTRSAV